MTRFIKPPMSLKEAQRIIREITGLLARELEGKEYDRIRTMILLMEPFEVDSSSQRAVTEKYKIGNDIYYVYYFYPDQNPIIDLILKERNED
jgi:hypothetical protein